MLRLIIKLWPNLLRGNRNERDEANQLLNDEDSPNKATGPQLKDLSEQTKQLYKNEYWSRVVAVDSHDPQESKRWSIAPDLYKEHEVLFTIDQDELPAFSPYFDPAEFVQHHPN